MASRLDGVKKDDIVARECRFVVHCGRPSGQQRDLHMVKEVVYLKDGREIPNYLALWDFKRPFGVTKVGQRNHEQKKEEELLTNLDIYETTQSDLGYSISKALRLPITDDVRRLARSPYLYGADILSTAVIKEKYQSKWPDKQTPFSVAMFDTERDVVKGTNEMIMASLAFRNKVLIVIQKSFLNGYASAINRLQEAAVKYLGEYCEKRNIEWDFRLVDSEIDVVRETIKTAHEWSPDILAIWNMDYDITEIISVCERAGVDPANIFSDPCVPQPYRFFKYKRGPKQKKTASGKVMPVKPADNWHTVFTPSSFYILDAMCVYRKLRIANGDEPSYALDAILSKNLRNKAGEEVHKLRFPKADGYSGLEWHQFMQENYQIEYSIYCGFDSIGMQELDEKTLDLCIAFPEMAGYTDFSQFKSQPRRVVDKLHYHALSRGYMYGTTSDEMGDEIDDLTVSGDGWIKI